MEIVIYSAFTVFFWMLSLTVLLPFILLLKLNTRFRNFWFYIFYARILSPRCGEPVVPYRKRVFELLEEDMHRRDKSVPLKFLEIGVGPGANFPFYPENSKLTVVDMNPSFGGYFDKLKKKYPHIDFERTVIGMAEDMSEVEDSSMDVVVSTYVLCSVTDLERTLKEIKRVLKPGGRLLFIEHVAYENFGWNYALQQAITPLWKIYFDGCCPNRDILKFINKAGFTTVNCEKFVKTYIFLYLRPHIIGFAKK